MKKKTCADCKHFRIKSDTAGICDHPNWGVTNHPEEVAAKMLEETHYTDAQRLNLARFLVGGVRVEETFGCNQWEKK